MDKSQCCRKKNNNAQIMNQAQHNNVLIPALRPQNQNIIIQSALPPQLFVTPPNIPTVIMTGPKVAC